MRTFFSPDVFAEFVFVALRDGEQALERTSRQKMTVDSRKIVLVLRYIN